MRSQKNLETIQQGTQEPGPARRVSRRDLLRSSWAVALAGAAGSMPVAAAAATKPWTDPATSFYANFDGARLLDQEGRAFKPFKLMGRLVLVNFVFTACSTACPVQMAALVDMQRQLPAALRSRVHLLSISLDPLSDTPKTLNDFARRLGIDPSGWTLATGRPQDIERLSDALRLYRNGPDVRKPDDHSTAVWLLDGTGAVRMRYAGHPPDVPRLLRELAALDQLTRHAQSRRPIAP